MFPFSLITLVKYYALFSSTNALFSLWMFKHWPFHSVFVVIYTYIFNYNLFNHEITSEIIYQELSSILCVHIFYFFPFPLFFHSFFSTYTQFVCDLANGHRWMATDIRKIRKKLYSCRYVLIFIMAWLRVYAYTRDSSRSRSVLCVYMLYMRQKEHSF